MIAGVVHAVAAMMAAIALAACSGESTYMPTSKDDPAMNAAIAEARSTLPLFWSKYDAAKGQGEFLVKAGMTDRNGGKEHIWMDVVSRSGDTVKGRLANVPEYLDDLQQGSEVTVTTAELSDWAYGKAGKYYGMYTTRVLLDRMTTSQRTEAMQMLAPTTLEPQTH